MCANEEVQVDSIWKRFLRKQFPERFQSDDEFIERIRTQVARFERLQLHGLILAVAFNLAILFGIGGLLVRLLKNVPFGNNLPAAQIGVWVGFLLGAILGCALGKFEMNVVHSLGELFGGIRTQQLLIRYVDELRSARDAKLTDVPPPDEE